MKEYFFNVRVYGIWINQNSEVLLTDECIMGKYLTKFPGGGLEFGEGLIDCLKREWQEELAVDIEVIRHFYTTDFFQVSVFNPNDQVISVYYLVKPLSLPKIELKTRAFDFVNNQGEMQVFRFILLNQLKSFDLSLPIDQKVAQMLREEYA